MDIIRFAPQGPDTKLEAAEIIPDIKTVMWIEKYDIAGEFKITGDVSSDLKN